MNEAVEAPDAIRVVPICATYWTEPEDPNTETPNFDSVDSPFKPAALECLAEAVTAEYTVWIETYLAGLTYTTRKWFEGQYDIWGSRENPIVDWSEMKEVLESVDLEPPPPTRMKGEEPTLSLLRALPYAYTRGTFGTVRDAFMHSDDATDRGPHPTIFPIVGFDHRDKHGGGQPTSYVAFRAAVAVADHVVITLRLPNLLCFRGLDESDKIQKADTSLEIPRRFLPLQGNPQPLAVAEGIGIHQATTARGVANQIRRSLTRLEKNATNLNDPEGDEAKRGSKLQHEVREAIKEIDQHVDTVNSLDQHISLILRRLGGEAVEEGDPAASLVPREVRRRYKFALDEIHSLREDCHLASGIAKQALSIYDQRLHERFQTFATVLASVVLIPTLVVGVFGVSVKVPAEESSYAFPALVALIVIVSLSTYIAFQGAHNERQKLRIRNRPLAVGIAVLGIALAVVVLGLSEAV